MHLKLFKRTIISCPFCQEPLHNLGAREFSYRTWVCRDCLTYEFYKISIDCNRDDEVQRIHTSRDRFYLYVNYLAETTKLSQILHRDELSPAQYKLNPPTSPSGYLSEVIVKVPYVINLDFRNPDEIASKIKMLLTFS